MSEEVRPFEEYKEMIKDMRKEEMIKGLYDLSARITEQNKEIERLNKLISQREKKWEKWTTEKTILSTKMSDYLCKYQNIKREYTKQIKISTDRKKEIERLNKEVEKYKKRCYEALMLIRENYGVLDKYGIDMLDDILNGK